MVNQHVLSWLMSTWALYMQLLDSSKFAGAYQNFLGLKLFKTMSSGQNPRENPKYDILYLSNSSKSAIHHKLDRNEKK